MAACREDKMDLSPVSLAAVAAALLLSACQPETKAQAPEIRPVRTVAVVKRDVGETVTYTGRIEAENETRLSYPPAFAQWHLTHGWDRTADKRRRVRSC